MSNSEELITRMNDEDIVEVNPRELLELSDAQRSYLSLLIPAYGKILLIKDILVWKPNNTSLTTGSLELLAGVMRDMRIALSERKKVVG